MPERKVNRRKNMKNRRKTENSKPIKLAALIVSAIQDLRESKGTTPNKISGYISYASNLHEGQVKRQVINIYKLQL